MFGFFKKKKPEENTLQYDGTANLIRKKIKASNDSDAVTKEAFDVLTANDVAYIYIEKGAPQKAIDHIKAQLKDILNAEDPTQHFIYDTLAYAHYLIKDHRAALDYSNISINHGEVHSELAHCEHYFNRARIKIAMQNFESAKDDLNKAIDLKSDYNEAKELLKSLTKENGVVTEHYNSGQLWKEYEVTNGIRNGYYKEYHENGQLRVEIKFSDGSQEDGWVVTYHDNGNKAREVFVEKILYQGEFQEWFPDGRQKLKGIYKDDQVVEILYKSEELES